MTKSEYALDRAECARIAYWGGFITLLEAEKEIKPYLRIQHEKEKIYARLGGPETTPRTMTVKKYLGIV